MKRLFVDTAGWMAMADGSDPLHISSMTARDHWLKSGGILCSSNYVVDETLTLVRMRLGMDAARQWWMMISQSPRCKIEWITPQAAGTLRKPFYMTPQNTKTMSISSGCAATEKFTASLKTPKKMTQRDILSGMALCIMADFAGIRTVSHARSLHLGRSGLKRFCAHYL